MPISDSKKCIFIHIPKCAGTSIEYALGIHGDNHDIGLKPQLEQVYDKEFLWGRGSQHFTAQKVKQIIGEKKFNDYYKFAIVRNPHDRFISHIAWKKQWGKRRLAIHKKITFFDILLTVFLIIFQRATNKVDPHLMKQVEYVTDVDGNLMLDCIGKFESLDDEWKKISAELNIKESLESRMKTDTEDKKRYFNKLTFLMVGYLYKDDIKAFGYGLNSKNI